MPANRLQYRRVNKDSIRHGVRWAWNEAALYKHYEETKQRILACLAEDSIIQMNHLSLQSRITFIFIDYHYTWSERE